ncbi:beta-N-acetylhexosaminidase [Sulfitobacter aestuariivivens]|uniref:beta-N-acetylhexosaminidase n=1 Tax=Sulfitobacter aestuariivivens TaxID=2766981 RepID=A0A927D1S2_9RHOB|nr:beta-N-acetylhexosaminidase [Sulfitobacter aestuariivivens]MBD3663439.1 beta-N-acetylhexosaminidase [Sulfitobacter aestuariivivens]
MAPFGATIIDADGLRLTPDEKSFFREADPFGFILFARNIDTPDQVRALCDDMRDCVGRDVIITVDQEGGRVQRLRAPHWRDWPAPFDVVEAAGDRAERALYCMYRVIAAELHALGIDSNCAPTLDVARAHTHPFLRNRCLGSDPARVADLGRAAADGMLEGGVVPVIKHMPGHGLSALDTHFDLPTVSAERQVLDDIDFAPFNALNDLPMGMTAHLVFDAIDPRPATLSPDMMRIIRDDIGFDGLIMTDDISMKALQAAPADSARAAIVAGCDIALYCNAPLADRIKVVEAAGTLDARGMARAQRAMKARKTPTDVDISALCAEFDALTGGALHG